VVDEAEAEDEEAAAGGGSRVVVGSAAIDMGRAFADRVTMGSIKLFSNTMRPTKLHVSLPVLEPLRALSRPKSPLSGHAQIAA
jgi:hypothetical protein